MYPQEGGRAKRDLRSKLLKDVVFLLDDDSYLHFAFVTGHNSKDAMLKSAGYDIRLHERDGRDVYSVIIYTADVKTKPK